MEIIIKCESMQELKSVTESLFVDLPEGNKKKQKKIFFILREKHFYRSYSGFLYLLGKSERKGERTSCKALGQ